jgi:hypothetical protein
VNERSGCSKRRKASTKPRPTSARERRALGLAEEHAARPGDGIVHVAILGRHVEVAHHRDARVWRELGLEPRGERLEPAQLVRVLVGSHALPLGT